MNYLLLSSIALALFYLFYKLLLSHDTLHRLNRVMLLLALFLSAALPLVHLNLGTTSQTLSVLLQELIVSPDVLFEPTAAGVDTPATAASQPWQSVARSILLFIYILGVVLFLTRFVAGLIRSLRLGSKGFVRLDDGCRLILHDTDYAPFSWMNRIVVSNKDFSENGTMILAHERAHIRLKHSWDLLFVQLCCIVQWFNPAVWLVKKELQAVHEYEADEATLRGGVDARKYQLRLIETALGAKFSSIANNFTNISTKKRILMMMKKQTSPWACLKALYMLPVAALIVVAASCQPANGKEPAKKVLADKVETAKEGKLPGGDDNTTAPKTDRMKTAKALGAEDDVLIVVDGKETTPEEFNSIEPGAIESITVLKEKSATEVFGSKAKSGAIVVTMKKTPEANVNDVTVNAFSPSQPAKPVEGDEVFQVVEVMPEFPGGTEGLMKFLSQNIKYPKEAQEAGTQGRVIVSFTVKKDGTCDDFKVVKSVDPVLDAEALRVLREMPRWTPGKQRGKEVNVRFTIPVQFKLNKPEPQPEK